MAFAKTKRNFQIINIIVIGAGGHAKVILATLDALCQNVIGLVDDNPSAAGHQILGYKVLGNLSLLNQYPDHAVICAIGDNKTRRKIATLFSTWNWISAVHPKAYVHKSVCLGKGTVVFAGAHVQPDTVLGEHVIVNTAASIDHDCHIEDFAHVGPGAHLGGNVKVSEGTLIGLGSSIKPGSTIGAWSVIGSGSVVVSNIKSYAYAKGVPAKVYKDICIAANIE